VYFNSVGRTYHFECPHCQYRARVSGGTDGGVNCVIQTIACRNCRELFDVFTRVRKRDSGAKAEAKMQRKMLPERLSIPPMMLVQHVNREFQNQPRLRVAPPAAWWENVKVACPISELHRIELWKHPGRCPRCGNFMEKNGFPFRLWD
jgi:hypothetical protein